MKTPLEILDACCKRVIPGKRGNQRAIAERHLCRLRTAIEAQAEELAQAKARIKELEAKVNE